MKKVILSVLISFLISFSLLLLFLFSQNHVEKINANLGKKVALKYEQHIGLPTSCFGDTEYFVYDVQVLND